MTAPSFRSHAVRDALGLVRLLWVQYADSTELGKRATLATIGATLSDCLRLGACDPSTVGYRAAVSRSHEALDQLVSLGWEGLIAELVLAAKDRVTTAPVAVPADKAEVRKGQVKLRD